MKNKKPTIRFIQDYSRNFIKAMKFMKQFQVKINISFKPSSKNIKIYWFNTKINQILRGNIKPKI